MEKYYRKIPSDVSLKEASMQLDLAMCIDEYFDVYVRPDISGFYLFHYKAGYEVFWAERAGKYPRWEFISLRKAATSKLLAIFNLCGHQPPDVPDLNKYLKENSLREPLGDGRG